MNIKTIIQQYTNEYFSYNSKFKRLPLKNHFCLIFRHDMDAIDEKLLENFLKKESCYESRSTLFFRANQFKKLCSSVKLIDVERYEIGLHSEARPLFLPSRPELSKIIEVMYNRNLRNQINKAESILGKELSGHSPHAFHNYLPFKAAMNWLIIEKATLGVTDYLSNWKIPSYTPQGNEFPFNYEEPYKINSNRDNMVVFSTCWDDKFFSTQEEIEFQKIKNNSHSLGDGLNSVKTHLENCKKKKQPMIINLHPYLWFADKKYFQLKLKLSQYCEKSKIPILTFKEYLESLNA